MLHTSLFRGLKSGPQRTKPASDRRKKPPSSLAARRRSFAPRLETLEDRTVPSGGGYNFQTIDPPQAAQVSAATLISNSGRSEERRVGKECRSRTSEKSSKKRRSKEQ